MAALKEDSILFFFWDAIFDYIALTLLLTVPNGTLSVTTKQTKNEKKKHLRRNGKHQIE